MGRAFICDNCGERVSMNASECPRCHHIFKAVRCSQCGYSGAASEFISGCPVCHYFGESHLANKGNMQKNRTEKISPKGTGGLKILILILLSVLVLSGIIYYFFGQ